MDRYQFRGKRLDNGEGMKMAFYIRVFFTISAIVFYGLGLIFTAFAEEHGAMIAGMDLKIAGLMGGILALALYNEEKNK